jgi:Rps23 Pro-64 3,4-dihydroxylase Tpa1-like proline 4-hydroxylase
VKASSPVLVRPYNDLLKNSILNQLLKNNVIKHTDYSVMNFVWTKLSYIPWHDDPAASSAITVYLNEKWHRDWGGIYLFSENEGEQIRGYIPKFNSAVKSESRVMHATTIISSDAETPRITVQLFSSGVPLASEFDSTPRGSLLDQQELRSLRSQQGSS